MFLPEPFLDIVLSSTSFFSADSTEELPKLGQAISASFLVNFPTVFSTYVLTISYDVLFVPAFSAIVIRSSKSL